MKTVTEFNGFSIKDAISKKGELTTAGKQGDELNTALAEALKLEGDKLKHFMAALTLAEQRPAGLKRIIVLTLAEGEKAPAGALEKEGSYYMAEFFPQPPEKNKGKRGFGEGRDGRGRDGKGRGKGDRKKGGRGGDRAGAPGGRDGGRPPGGDRSARPARDDSRGAGANASGRRPPGGGRGPTAEIGADGKKTFQFKRPENPGAKPGGRPAGGRPPRGPRTPQQANASGPLVKPLVTPLVKPLAQPVKTETKTASTADADSAKNESSSS